MHLVKNILHYHLDCIEGHQELLLVYTLMGIIYRNRVLFIVTCVTFSGMDFMISPLPIGIELGNFSAKTVF